MNERIRELYNKVVGDDKLNFDSYLAEKFAQLIVKECVGIVAKRKDQAIDDDCNVDEAMTMAEMDLLDNFGVEE
jgi:hypothetical protein